jgi:L-serine dehydratase
MDNAMSISEVVFENEKMWRSQEAIVQGLMTIWDTMRQSIWRGVHTEGVLPGGLNVQRRAAQINKEIQRNE